MSQAVAKSAINVLDEFCKRKLQPPAVYAFNPDETSDFVCTVKSFNETKTGRAKSKKKAKHSAAQNLIDHLRCLESFKFDLVFLNVPPPLSVDETKVSSSTTSQKKPKATTNPVPEINYVGKLLEYCTKSKLPPASFEAMESTTNSQNVSEFCMKCKLNDIEKLGTGPNKKQAKRMAAMEVLEALRLVGKATPKDEFDEPPLKRLNASDVDTTPENIAVNTENNNLFDDYNNSPSDSHNDDGQYAFSDETAVTFNSSGQKTSLHMNGITSK